MGSKVAHMDSKKAHMGITLKAAIDAAGQSVLSLSESTGIPRVTLGRKLKRPEQLTVAELDLIAEALGIPASDLLAVDVKHEAVAA